MTDPTLKALGLALRARRNAQGLTLRELALRADLSFRHLGEIERGNANPRWTTVARIANALGWRAVFVEKSEGDGRR
jgi:transcriptional regulator with XRE-family HTH domain